MADELILTNDHIAIAALGVSRSGRWRGYCPFHAGSTAYDLVVDRDFIRFLCIACGATGWTESDYQRYRASLVGTGDAASSASSRTARVLRVLLLPRARGRVRA